MRIVQKYGGSSLASISKIQDIAKHLKELKQNECELVVVVSAMGKTTNSLLNLAEEVTNNPDKRELDFLVSTGEMISASLLSICLNSLGVDSICLTGWQAGIITNENFGKAFICDIYPERILMELEKNKIVIITGFQGISENQEITTLGRGGSDTSAVALASVLDAKCEIYTDVDAVCFIDPKIYNNTKKIHKVSYKNMLELAFSGAKVLDVRCLEIGYKYNVDLYLGRTLETNNKKGTKLMKDDFFEQIQVSGIAVLDRLCMYRLKRKDFENVFDILKTHMVSLDLFLLEGDDSVFTMREGNLNLLDKDLEKIEYDKILDVCKITIAGSGFATHNEHVYELIDILKRNNIHLLHFNLTETCIYLFIKNSDLDYAIKLLMEYYDGKEN